MGNFIAEWSGIALIPSWDSASWTSIGTLVRRRYPASIAFGIRASTSTFSVANTPMRDCRIPSRSMRIRGRKKSMYLFTTKKSFIFKIHI